jgi:hypothetical protein
MEIDGKAFTDLASVVSPSELSEMSLLLLATSYLRSFITERGLGSAMAIDPKPDTDNGIASGNETRLPGNVLRHSISNPGYTVDSIYLPRCLLFFYDVQILTTRRVFLPRYHHVPCSPKHATIYTPGTPGRYKVRRFRWPRSCIPGGRCLPP